MKLNVEQFQRKPRKSLSQKKNFDDFISKENNLKRLSQLNENNKLLSDFYSSVEKSKLQSRSSLPLQFPPDNLSNHKNNNTEENNNDKRSSNNSKDLEHSSRDKMSFQNKTKTQFDSFYGGVKDIKIVWKNRPEIKEEDKEKEQLDKYYEKIEAFMNNLFENKNNENTDTNLSSSTLGPGGSKKSFMKSEDKNTKINLKNIITFNEKNNTKSNSNCVILSDIQHVEKQNNKLDVLINIMEEYKDIITEKMFCKNFQDRLNLDIFICLSKMSFKLYNCVENKKKFENIRKYICTLTDDIKYNLINNPNFTISLINQKLIDIDRLDKSILFNNEEDIKINDNNPINSIESSLNLNNKMKKIDFSQNSDSESNKDKIKENFVNFDDEEIIYENFEEFNADNGNENDLYVNPNFFCEVDNKDNNVKNVNNHIEHSPEAHIQSVVESNFMQPPKSPNKKTRRNATHRLVINKCESKANNNNNTNNQKRYFNPNNYNFHIIDINGQIDDKELSEDSIDSDEECIEVIENCKSEKQKLIFFEDYLRDKDKRRLTKIDPLQIDPDQKFLQNRERLIELNKLSYKNIIDIVKDNTSLLPNYKLDLDPKALANEINEINEIEKFAGDNKSINSKDENKDKILLYSNDSSNGNNNIKESKRFELNNINEEIDNIDNNGENDDNENDNVDNDNNKKLNDKSFSSESDKLLDENKRILNLNFIDNEDD